MTTWTFEDATEWTDPTNVSSQTYPLDEPEPRQPPDEHQDAHHSLLALRAELAVHPLWRCRLLRACDLGLLTLEDFRFLFGQYYLYSSHFTRYLSALMASCEDDYFRSKLAQNLWEEGGMQRPQDRHTQIFRDFLGGALGLDIAALEYRDFTRYFAAQYLDFCRSASPAEASAFLGLGTEAIVAPLYKIFCNGLRKAGVPDDRLKFFHLHIAGDDDHAATLNQMTLSYRRRPDWSRQVREAANHALELRMSFFNALYQGIREHRLRTTYARIQGRASLCPPAPAASELLVASGGGGLPLYQNRIDRLNVDFSVQRLPFAGEVLDTRLVKIPPGRANECHRHAHESIFHIKQGRGRVQVNETLVEVGPGDTVFVPRWALHQSRNVGAEELIILAITDFGLTGKAFIGDYDRTARLRRQSSELAREPGPETSQET
jgi:mannose-6-phosphate isomerase-like protein (cupin superfamily)